MTKPIIVVKYAINYCMSFKWLKRFLMINNFLVSTDIKVFGCTYLFVMLLLIGLALLFHPRCHITTFLEVQTHVITSKQQRSTAWA